MSTALAHNKIGAIFGICGMLHIYHQKLSNYVQLLRSSSPDLYTRAPSLDTAGDVHIQTSSLAY